MIRQATREEIYRNLAALRYVENLAPYPFVLVGIRGYQAAQGQNKRNVYDDAIVLLTDTICQTFPANTDPSKRGLNPRIGKGYAVLKPGFYPSYRFDIHNGSKPHPAICQRAAPVTVVRDGNGKEETGMLGINIHAAFGSSTSSEGCQTQPKKQYMEEFYPLAKSEAVRLFGERWDEQTILYVLLDAANYHLL